jgi:hypothetical protein
VTNLAVSSDVVLKERDGEAFLLHLPSGRYFGLNRSGLVVWNAIAAGEDPADALERQWPDVPSERRSADLETILGALVDADLAQVVAAPES